MSLSIPIWTVFRHSSASNDVYACPSVLTMGVDRAVASRHDGIWLLPLTAHLRRRSVRYAHLYCPPSRDR